MSTLKTRKEENMREKKVIIPNPKSFEDKKKAITARGAENFYVVLLGDPSMSFINKLIGELLG